MQRAQFLQLPEERKAAIIAWQEDLDEMDRRKIEALLRREMGARFAFVGVENRATGKLKFLLPVLPDADVIWPDEEAGG